MDSESQTKESVSHGLHERYLPTLRFSAEQVGIIQSTDN